MSLVLVVDDEEALLEVLCEVIASLGHECIRAHDGRDALACARQRPPDLIITDYMMPRVSGVELVKALRDEPPPLRDVPVIMMSAGQPDTLEGAALFLAKPVTLPQIEHAIGAVMRGLDSTARSSTRVAANFDFAKEELLNWVAHEVKTPLSSALLACQLLSRRAGDDGPEAIRSRVTTIVRQIEEVSATINQVLDAARAKEGRIELELHEVDLVAFVEERIDHWRSLRDNFDFVVRKPEGPVNATIDRRRVEQILDNLLSNAVKYSGGSTAIEVDVATSDDGPTISVRDHGIGIGSEDLPYVFDRFYRAKEAPGHGHGLGLYISSTLARLHGGDIIAGPMADGGSKFTLRLPRAGHA